ncbi:hypothetical protein [Mucilaginibacter ginsenosidivorax]|uniref:Uncharacterized protein n=1 Tax=Mucilaginibacter ginsenosidivorax TaxID=862126 RepID=A0A5B8VVP4_9SPHI|nr:hypothetical protein [Mucilaginibacter ginsenosidivorax]QEC75657.1 hypothetical protein FSB76_06730 [Mucilaginibacter ginsenosidivorax]
MNQLIDANSFEYKYERLESSELIAIIRNSRNFQPLAVETAYIELQRRDLPPEQFKEVNDEFNLYLKRKVTKQTQELNSPKAEQAKKAPVNQQFFSAKRVIGIVSLTVLAVYFITLAQGDTAVLRMITESSSYRPSFLFIVVPYLMLPLGAIGFGLRKKLGWIMLSWAVMYNALKQAYFFKKDLDIKLNDRYADIISTDEVIRNIIVISFFVLISVIVCLPGIRAKMKTGILTMVLTMVAAVGFLALQVMKVI